MEPIVVSLAAAETFPTIVDALTAAGLAWRIGEAGSELAVRTPSGRCIFVKPATRSAAMIARACELTVAARDHRFAGALIAELCRPPGQPVVADPATAALYALAARVARRDVGMLIEGPTGTGKEVLSRFIHDQSQRRAGPFVAINCAAIPDTMLEASLFGHERGAFTGAGQASKGLFRAAHGGTLLLDEIAELPLGLQAKLLRVLQEREVMPIGGTSAIPIDVRVVAATNRDLAAEAAAGRFRSDLYYRLGVFPVHTQPLSERPADIVALTAALLMRHVEAGPLPWPTPEALGKLADHRWPGNVRELDNVLQRALILADHATIDASALRFDRPVHIARPPAMSDAFLGDIVRHREFEAIEAALSACNGRRIDTATRLGISERTLRYKLAEMAQLRGRSDMVLQ